MPTPGQIATDMQQALHDLEDALHRMSAALGLAPYQAPTLRHPDRAYVDMVRTRALAQWLMGAAEALSGVDGALDAAASTSAQASVWRATLEQALGLLTKAQLINLGASLGVEGLSDSQRKDDLVAALIEAAAYLATVAR